MRFWENEVLAAAVTVFILYPWHMINAENDSAFGLVLISGSFNFYTLGGLMWFVVDDLCGTASGVGSLFRSKILNLIWSLEW